jgi:ribA/ribD-fused uncharacterized protein
LFHDEDIRKQILATKHPSVQKKLGRQISHFDEDTWKKHRYEIVLRGNVAKFTQHPNLLKMLLETKKAIIAEASPYDLIWGIGYDEHHPNAQDPTRWKGQNLLGNVLMDVRSLLV